MAYGAADLAHDIRLDCRGLDKNDNDFIVDMEYRPRWEPLVSPPRMTVEDMLANGKVVKFLARPSHGATHDADSFLLAATEVADGLLDTRRWQSCCQLAGATDVAAEEFAKIEKAGIGGVHFAWAGGFELGQPHYYRIQNSSFVLEYDNTQNNANHVHAVWRDFTNDFGEDLLKKHYERAHKK